MKTQILDEKELKGKIIEKVCVYYQWQCIHFEGDLFCIYKIINHGFDIDADLEFYDRAFFNLDSSYRKLFNLGIISEMEFNLGNERIERKNIQERKNHELRLLAELKAKYEVK